MARTMNVGRRVETLIDKAFMHHNIAMRSQMRYAARPETTTGQMELKRMQKHEDRLAAAIDDLKKLVESKF